MPHDADKHASQPNAYVHFCGVAGGLAGSFIGFSLFDTTGALVGGLLGIVGCEVAARFVFGPKSVRK
jgi:hypothetical protein